MCEMMFMQPHPFFGPLPGEQGPSAGCTDGPVYVPDSSAFPVKDFYAFLHILVGKPGRWKRLLRGWNGWAFSLPSCGHAREQQRDAPGSMLRALIHPLPHEVTQEGFKAHHNCSAPLCRCPRVI